MWLRNLELALPLVSVLFGTALAEATPTETPVSIATDTPDPSPTHTAAGSPTTSPTRTRSRTPTASPTPTPPCVGDCNGDRSVTVDELLVMVNLALGAAHLACDVGDANHDGAITVDEIVVAVNNDLTGCPVSPEQGCLDSGGTVAIEGCCSGVDDFPDTCAFGACGCPPQTRHDVRVCVCPVHACFDGAKCVTILRH